MDDVMKQANNAADVIFLIFNEILVGQKRIKGQRAEKRLN